MASEGSSRLDAALVQRGLVHSRTRAAQLIRDGGVQVDGRTETRVARSVTAADDVALVPGALDPWVSRGAHKLVAALDSAARLMPPGVVVNDRHGLDVGASTGGFTQVLLSAGARAVDAVDVGHDQLAQALRDDRRVRSREGLNVRDLAAADLSGRPDVIVGDLSFISLRLVLARLLAVAAPGADLLLLVKPQFEVGRERLGSGGVVVSAELREEAVVGVAREAVDQGATPLAVVPSGLPGEAGNREYFLWLRADRVGLRADRGERRGCWPDVAEGVVRAARRAVRDDEPALVTRGPEEVTS